MQVNHKILRLVFAFGVGLLVWYASYQWVTNQDRANRRAIEEGVVRESRLILEDYVDGRSDLEISDALNRVREAGKVYIYPADGGWELSGQYRRIGEKRWHPYLMSLDGASSLVSLSVEDEDPALAARAVGDPKFSVFPSK